MLLIRSPAWQATLAVKLQFRAQIVRQDIHVATFRLLLRFAVKANFRPRVQHRVRNALLDTTPLCLEIQPVLSAQVDTIHSQMELVPAPHALVGLGVPQWIKAQFLVITARLAQQLKLIVLLARMVSTVRRPVALHQYVCSASIQTEASVLRAHWVCTVLIQCLILWPVLWGNLPIFLVQLGAWRAQPGLPA